MRGMDTYCDQCSRLYGVATIHPPHAHALADWMERRRAQFVNSLVEANRKHRRDGEPPRTFGHNGAGIVIRRGN